MGKHGKRYTKEQKAEAGRLDPNNPAILDDIEEARRRAGGRTPALNGHQP